MQNAEVMVLRKQCVAFAVKIHLCLCAPCENLYCLYQCHDCLSHTFCVPGGTDRIQEDVQNHSAIHFRCRATLLNSGESMTVTMLDYRIKTTTTDIHYALL